MLLQKTHWTYKEYQDQPKWLLEAIAAQWDGEAEYRRVQKDLEGQKTNG